MATGSSSSDGVVVWEWMNEYGHWTPYHPHVSTYIEHHTGCPQVYLGTIDRALSMYIIDFNSMCQIRQGSGTPRPVRRHIFPLESPMGQGVLWQYEGNSPGSWINYDIEVGCMLEDFYAKKATVIDLGKTSIPMPYTIDLIKMQQTRIDTQRIRKIRRELLSSRYPTVIPVSGTASATNSVPSTSSGAILKSKRRHTCQGNDNSSSSDSGSNTKPTQRRFRRKKKALSKKSSNGPTSNSIGSASFHGAPANAVTGTNMNAYADLNNNGMGNLHLGANGLLNNNSITITSPINMQTNAPTTTAQVLTNGLTPLSTISQQSQLANGPMTRNRFHSVLNMLPGSSSSSFPINAGSSTEHSSQIGSTPVAQGYRNLASAPISQGFTNSIAVPTSLPPANRGKSHGSYISPVMTSVSNMLMSPAVPVMLSPPQVPVFMPPSLSKSDLKPVTGLPGVVKEGRIASHRTHRGKVAAEVLSTYLKVLDKPIEDEDCCICFEKLSQASGYGDGKDSVIVQLAKCVHTFHRLCLYAMYDSGQKDGSIQCPTCKMIYGEKYGNCPSGDMDVHVIPHSLSGHSDTNTIRIVYHIPAGIQGPEHPNPGMRYSARGFPRHCFLPDNEDGRKVLGLLVIAWQRRLTFTIGHSTTTGEANTVTWNEIHHKTEFGSNVSGHGYPDPNYIENVLMELSVQGVTEEDLS